MSDLESIEARIRSLTPEQLAEFRRWFHEFDARAWDEELSRDAALGKLDGPADAALEEHASGGSTKL